MTSKTTCAQYKPPFWWLASAEFAVRARLGQAPLLCAFMGLWGWRGSRKGMAGGSHCAASSILCGWPIARVSEWTVLYREESKSAPIPAAAVINTARPRLEKRLAFAADLAAQLSSNCGDVGCRTRNLPNVPGPLASLYGRWDTDALTMQKTTFHGDSPCPPCHTLLMSTVR